MIIVHLGEIRVTLRHTLLNNAILRVHLITVKLTNHTNISRVLILELERLIDPPIVELIDTTSICKLLTLVSG